MISHCFQHVDRLEHIWAVKVALEEILDRPALREWFGGDEVPVTVRVLEAVRDWTAWFGPTQVRLEGGMRDDATGMHCWLFMLRKDVPPAWRIEPASYYGVHLASHPLDVVCVVKQRVWEATLAQPPFVVMPNVAYERLTSPVPLTIRPPNPPTPQNVKTWMQLAKALLRSGSPEHVGAVQYLLALAKGERCRGDLIPLPWHTASLGEDVVAADVYAPITLKRMVQTGRVKVRVLP